VREKKNIRSRDIGKPGLEFGVVGKRIYAEIVALRLDRHYHLNPASRGEFNSSESLPMKSEEYVIS